MSSMDRPKGVAVGCLTVTGDIAMRGGCFRIGILEQNGRDHLMGSSHLTREEMSPLKPVLVA